MLGSGQFGTVMKAKWHEEEEEEVVVKVDLEKKEGEQDEEKESEGAEKRQSEGKEVAVKILKEGSDSLKIVKFLQEATIMGQFNHPNVVSLHGVVIIGEPVSLSHASSDRA